MPRPKPRPGSLAKAPSATSEAARTSDLADNLAEVGPEVRAAILEARMAPPPWEQERWLPAPPSKYPPGELLARGRKRLALTRPSLEGTLVSVNLRDLSGKREKAPEQMRMTKLKDARRKAQKLAEVVRDDAFDDWVRRCIVSAECPDEWTQAALLYESYIRHAKNFGWNRGDRALATEGLATETRWGKMMGSLFTKTRRRRGQYYPLRLKQGV